MLERRIKRAARALAGILLGGTVATISEVAVGAGGDCEQLVSRFSASIKTDNLSQIVASGSPIISSGACSSSTRGDVARRLALFHLAEAAKVDDRSGSDRDRLKLLVEGERFSKPWQLMAAIGDTYRSVKNADGVIDHQSAGRAYQDALLDINDKQAVPNPPPSDVIKRLIRLAQQSRLLAEQYSPMALTLSRDVRGVAVEAVPLPIQFVRDSHKMTQRGLAYSEELSTGLASQGRPAITLVGHTDPEGSASHNDALSLRRAEAVRDYLVQKGYQPPMISVAGVGSRDPLKVVDERQYSVAQIYQMNRRVEVRFR